MPRRKLSAAENSALPLQTAAVRRSRRTVIGNQPLNHSPLQSLPAPTRAKKNRSDLQAATSSNPTDDIATTTEEEEASASAPSRSPSADTGNQYSNITSRISESPTPSLQQKVFPQQEVPAKAASNKMARSSALVRAAEAEDESLLDAPITENLATPNKHARGEVFISGQPSAKRARHLADTTSRSTNTPMAEARTPAQLRHNDNTKKPVKKKIGGGYLTPGPMPRRTPYVIDPRTMTPHERRVDLYQRTGLRNRVEYQGPPEDDEPEIITHSDGTTRELSPLNQVNQYMLNHTIPSLPDIPASRYTGHSKTDKIFRKVYQIPEPAMAGALVKYNEEHPNTPVPNYFETYEALERFDARFDYTDPPTPDDINRKMQYHEEQEALKHQSAATLAEQVSRQQEPQNLVTNQGQSFFQNPFSAPLSAVKSLFAAGTDTTPTPTPSSTHSNSSSAKKLSPMPTKPGAFPGQRKASPRLSSVKSSKLKPSQQRQVAVKQMRSQNSAQRYLDFTIKAEEQRGYRRREALRTGERDQVTIEKDLELSKDYNSRTGRKRKAGAAGVAGSGYRVPDLDIESEGEGMEAESSQPEEQPATRFPRPGDPDFNYAGHFQVPDYSSSSNSDDEEEAVPEHSDQHNITVPPNFPVEADSLVHPTDINDAPSNVFSPGPSVPDMDIPLSPKPTPTKRDKDIDRPKHVRIDDAPAPRAAVAVEETIAEIPSTPAAPSAALQEKAWPQSAPPKTPRPANATLPQPSPTKTLKHQPIRPSTLREVQTASPLASPFASVDEVEHHDAMVVRDFVNGMMEGDIMRTMLPAFMRAPADGVENHDAMVIFDFVNGMMGGDVTGTTFPAFMTEAMASQGNKIEQAVALVV